MTSKKDFIRSCQEFSDRISRASVSVLESSLSHQASAPTLPRKRSAPTTNESKKNKKKEKSRVMIKCSNQLIASSISY